MENESKTGKESNFVFDEKEKTIEVKINPNIYPLATVFSASYSMMDKAYAVIDGDKKKQLVVTLWPKEGNMLKETAMLFSQELLNYSVCLAQAKKTEHVRQALAKRAFLAHSAAEENDLFIGDPLGIAKLWQEQEGKKSLRA